MWSKKGKNYSVQATKSKTIFNLNGTVINQPPMSQEEAVAFLNLNGYEGFKVDKKGQKVNGRDSGDLKEKLDF